MIGRGEGYSAVAIPLEDVLGGNEASETTENKIDVIGVRTGRIH